MTSPFRRLDRIAILAALLAWAVAAAQDLSVNADLINAVRAGNAAGVPTFAIAAEQKHANVAQQALLAAGAIE